MVLELMEMSRKLARLGEDEECLDEWGDLNDIEFRVHYCDDGEHWKMVQTFQGVDFGTGTSPDEAMRDAKASIRKSHIELSKKLTVRQVQTS